MDVDRGIQRVVIVIHHETLFDNGCSVRFRDRWDESYPDDCEKLTGLPWSLRHERLHQAARGRQHSVNVPLRPHNDYRQSATQNREAAGTGECRSLGQPADVRDRRKLRTDHHLACGQFSSKSVDPAGSTRTHNLPIQSSLAARPPGVDRFTECIDERPLTTEANGMDPFPTLTASVN
jgi:hypothetical protein